MIDLKFIHKFIYLEVEIFLASCLNFNNNKIVSNHLKNYFNIYNQTLLTTYTLKNKNLCIAQNFCIIGTLL